MSCAVSIDAMGVQASIARAIRDKRAGCTLPVENSQPKLVETIDESIESVTQFKNAAAHKASHDYVEQIEKDHPRLELRRCYAPDWRARLPNSVHWLDLNSFVIADPQRAI
jgi:hypothetical protein